ncbi:MAG: HD domain-containing protein [Bacilli bacterium]|nr:HD domain-containing protein [Bacilli bacterium]
MKQTGLIIQNGTDYLDKVTLKTSELRLLASGDGIEIMTHDLENGITFDIYPDEANPTLMEFFYILDGEIEYLTKDSNEFIKLTKGDYFYTKELTEPCVFRTLSKTKLLYISSQPIFHYIGEAYAKLHLINEEITRKDPYTKGHSERVQDLAVKIGVEMSLSRDRIAKLAIAALFHDLGKIFISDEILGKPHKLTSDEYELVKHHPIESAKYVNAIKYIDVGDIVLQHHERLDGSGYPFGLKGDDICIEARIIAVADTFDAMTSDRAYRNRLTTEQAIQEIVSLAGKLYDKDVVDAFLKVINKE